MDHRFRHGYTHPPAKLPGQAVRLGVLDIESPALLQNFILGQSRKDIPVRGLRCAFELAAGPHPEWL